MPSIASKQPSGAASTSVTRTPSRCGTGPVAARATTAGATGGWTTTTSSPPPSSDSCPLALPARRKRSPSRDHTAPSGCRFSGRSIGGMGRSEVRAERRRSALERFERATELPLLVLALIFIPLLVLPLAFDLPEAVDSTFVALDWFIWAVFVLTDAKARFVWRNVPDLIVIVVPFLRPLRIARSARALRLLRLGRLVALLAIVNREARRLLVRHGLHWALLTIGVIVLAAAALITVVEEREPGASIRNFGDGIWWAVTTITTVGYGDTYPVSDAGRGIAAAVMLAGITLFGFLTANLATFMLERSGHAQESGASGSAAIEAKLDELLERMSRIESDLARR